MIKNIDIFKMLFLCFCIWSFPNMTIGEENVISVCTIDQYKYFKQGIHYFKNKKYKAAEKYFRLSYSEKFPFAAYYIGRIFENKSYKNIKYIQKAIKWYKKIAFYKFNKIKIVKGEKDIQTFQGINKPSNVSSYLFCYIYEAKYRLGNIYSKYQPYHLREAENLLNQSVKYFSCDVEYWEILWKVYYLQNKFVKAAEAIKNVLHLTLDSKRIERIYMYILTQDKLGNQREVFTNWELIKNLIKLKKLKHEKLTEEEKKIEEKIPKNLDKINIAKLPNRTPKAAYLTKNLKYQEELDFKFLKAITAFKTGEYIKAEELFSDLLSNGFPPAAYFLGLIYEYGLGHKKNIEKAIRYYKHLLQYTSPTSITLDWYDEKGEKHTEEYTTKGNEYICNSKYRLAMIYINILHAKYDEAENLLKELLKLRHENSYYWDALWKLYYSQKKYKKALEAIKMAYKYNNKHISILYHCLLSYKILDIKDKVKETLVLIKKYIKEKGENNLTPEEKDILKKMKDLQSKL